MSYIYYKLQFKTEIERLNLYLKGSPCRGFFIPKKHFFKLDKKNNQMVIDKAFIKSIETLNKEIVLYKNYYSDRPNLIDPQIKSLDKNFKEKVSKNKVSISNDTFLIPNSIAEQIIKNSIEKGGPPEPTTTPPPITPPTEPTTTPPTAATTTTEPTIVPPAPTITPPEQVVEVLKELNLSIDFSWENLDLLMNLKNLLLLLGQKSESLKINLNIEFKASSNISGMNLSNIKKLLKELSEKIENIDIKSNIENFLNNN